MRIAVLILGLLLGLLMFFQAFLAYALSSAFSTEEQASAMAVGVFVCIIWLVACAFVIGFPLFSAIAFIVSAILAFAISGDFPDMGVWGSVALILAAMSFFGWRGKVKRRRAEAAELQRQRERDDRLEALLAQQRGGRWMPNESIEVAGVPVAAPGALPTGD